MPEATYPPLDVLKPVAEGVWIVDSGPLRVLGLPLPVRMTVVRLGDGSLWLHSPTRYDAALHRAIEAVGPIRHLVAPNIAHWTFLKDWQNQCPEALTWAAPNLRQRGQVRRSGLRIDRVLGDAAPPEWQADLRQQVVPGGLGFREVAFFHGRSRTLVLTDLVLNLEPAKMPAVLRPLLRLAGMTAPEGKPPPYLRLVIKLRRRDAARAAADLVALKPEAVVFAHGLWFAQDGTARLRRSLLWLGDFG
ncbi:MULTISPECIES: DUF4336 domain-containing protein [Methylobacterium]|uniref:DUF4336 domain-containing protein n=1 Tax=Methylobacterium TaxID=407 RepID=UPI0011C947BC|nr:MULTISPECIES: DUF4336 domain-containing protein [Methylobacterium]TXN46681.1 DUF4336 domain-containing protein [Methylobacterium sp. WL7]TXN74255.1 DUF4336 domain-containing protein [Methylobacterium sp. WL18]GJE24373.1 hypothetical protein JHFBIEKO_4845 [Methylobacterium mesophilicum]